MGLLRLIIFMNKKNTEIILEDWAIVGGFFDTYHRPEDKIKRLIGKVYNHPNPTKFPNEKKITTSSVFLATGECVVTRSGTKYKLGTVSPEYDAYMKKAYPVTWDPYNPNWCKETPT